MKQFSIGSPRRFSRSGTLLTLQKLKELENNGVFYHSYQDPYISTANEWKDILISIMYTLAKIERERISERTKAGFCNEQGTKALSLTEHRSLMRLSAVSQRCSVRDVRTTTSVRRSSTVPSQAFCTT